MHCPGSGKRHWEGRARASFCLLRWRTGGCSLVYDEEQWFCLVVVLYSHFLSFLSFRTHDDIRVFWTLGEFRAWEASTWNVLMSIMDLEEHFIFTTATRSRAQRQRIRTNAAEKPWLWEYPTTAFTRGRPNRRSRMACQVPELSLCFMRPFYGNLHE